MSGGCAQKSTPDINLNIIKNPVILWPALIDFDMWKSSRHNNSFTLLRHLFFNPSHHNWPQATQPQRRFMTKLTSTKEHINESVFFFLRRMWCPLLREYPWRSRSAEGALATISLIISLFIYSFE